MPTSPAVEDDFPGIAVENYLGSLLNPTPCPKFGDFAPSEKYAAVPYGSPGWTDEEFYSHTIDPSAKLFAVSYELMDCRASKVGMLLKCSANFTDGSEERRDAFGSVRAEYACCI